MTTNSQVCVVIPARNAGHTINETLRSACACRGVSQIVVVNDGSTDDTRAIAGAVGDDRIEIIEGPATGIAGALNAGFAAVRTPYVMRCDADDLIPPDRLEWQLPFLEKDPDLLAVSSGFETILDDGTPCGLLTCEGEITDVTQRLRDGQVLTHLCTWLIRMDGIRKVGGAREWFRTAEDVDLQFRLAAVGKILHVPRRSYCYRMHDSSILHSTSRPSLRFYDNHAEAFIKDRCKTGSDALDRGEPLPDCPQIVESEITSPIERGIGHAVGTAWSEARLGQHRAAIRRLWRLWLKAPGNAKLRRSFLKIMLYSLRSVFQRRSHG